MWFRLEQNVQIHASADHLMRCLHETAWEKSQYIRINIINGIPEKCSEVCADSSSPEDFGDSLKASKFSILPQKSFNSFQHLSGVHRAHGHSCLLTEREKSSVIQVLGSGKRHQINATNTEQPKIMVSEGELNGTAQNSQKWIPIIVSSAKLTTRLKQLENDKQRTAGTMINKKARMAPYYQLSDQTNGYKWDLKVKTNWVHLFFFCSTE